MNRDKVFEDLIQTIERNAINNIATISNVELWAKSWREELRQYLVSGSLPPSDAVAFAKWLKHIDNGTEHYNPFTKAVSPSVGFSPSECFDDGILTVEDLYKRFIELGGNDR